MAYKVFEDFGQKYNANAPDQPESITLTVSEGQNIDLPDTNYVTDSQISRDGSDLVLQTSNGTITIEGYFNAEPAPNLVGPDGHTLTPDLVNSFITSGSEFADTGMNANDASPVGVVQEVSGQATVKHLDGTVETIAIGTYIYQGDIIETDQNGAVNIMFIDETTFAVSEDARLAIDEYVYDPSTQSGESNFSVLKGVFVFTSGLIGRDDPDDVTIQTPSGSIGIRGTIIAGNVNTGEITVIEGAIVLTDYSGNSITLANQYETARFNPSESNIEHIGNLSAQDVSSKFASVSGVSANLFSSIMDNAKESEEQDNKQNSAPESPENTQESETQDESNATQAEPEAQTTQIITSEQIIKGDTQIITSPSKSTAPATTQNTAPAPTTTATQTIQPPTFNQTPQEQLAPVQGPTAATVSRSAPIAFFSGSQNSHFEYNFAAEFNDPDNRITGYQLISDLYSQSADILNGSVNFNSTTGLLRFNLNSTTTNDDIESFTIRAMTLDGPIDATYSFDVRDVVGTPTTLNPNITLNAGTVFSGDNALGGQININGPNVSYYGSNNDNLVTINNTGSLVKTSGGNDTITITTGSPYFAFGEAGNDTFIINNTTAMNSLQSGTNMGRMDGGTGQDTLKFLTGGNINFATMADKNFIKNIETINTDNGAANTVTLDYNSVLRMTDADNKLVIDLDSNDNFVFNRNGHNFTNVGSNGGFTEYTDGVVTLLVDDTHNAVSGIL